jgi:WD40 repeat protein
MQVWNTITGDELLTLEGHRNVVYAIAFNNPYGDKIITVSGMVLFGVIISSPSLSFLNDSSSLSSLSPLILSSRKSFLFLSSFYFLVPFLSIPFIHRPNSSLGLF